MGLTPMHDITEQPPIRMVTIVMTESIAAWLQKASAARLAEVQEEVLRKGHTDERSGRLIGWANVNACLEVRNLIHPPQPHDPLRASLLSERVRLTAASMAAAFEECAPPAETRNLEAGISMSIRIAEMENHAREIEAMEEKLRLTAPALPEGVVSLADYRKPRSVT